jgi:hypothetical protein
MNFILTFAGTMKQMKVETWIPAGTAVTSKLIGRHLLMGIGLEELILTLQVMSLDIFRNCPYS